MHLLVPAQVIFSAPVIALVATVFYAVMLLSAVSLDRLGMLGLEFAVTDTTCQHLMGVFVELMLSGESPWAD